MAYIRVDHSKFARTASEVEAYVSLMKKKMAAAQGEVDNMANSWQGSDFAQFKSQWEKVTEKESTYKEMEEALENYAKFLRYAEEKYKDAQAKAVNKANSLPKW